MYYENYGFWGMHLIWWFIWGSLLFWIFATPYDLPGQRLKRNSPLDLLKRRLATGEINNEEYLEKKKIMES
jgi:putative membrane protein